MKWKLTLILILILPTITAFKIEQEIAVINGQIFTDITSWTPTDGDMGIIDWNRSAYSDISEIYFEVDGEYDYTGPPNDVGSAQIRLYDLTNAAGMAESVINLGASPSLQRSGNLTYLFSKSRINVTVQLKAGVATDVWGNSARIVVVQNGAITQTRTMISIGANVGSTTICSVPANEINYPKRWLWSSAHYGGNVSLTYHVTAYSSINGKNIITDFSDGSTRITHFTINQNTPQHRISPKFNLSETTYFSGLCSIFAFPTRPTAIQKNAHLVIDQEVNPEDPVIMTTQQVENKLRTESSTNPQRDNAQANLYNYTNWDGVHRYFSHDVTYKSGVGGVKANTDKVIASVNVIDNSAINTTATTTTYSITTIPKLTYSGAVQARLWSNDSGNNVHIYSARLRILIDGLLCWTEDYDNKLIIIPRGCRYNMDIEDIVGKL